MTEKENITTEKPVELRTTLDEIMDWLSDLPEDEMRQHLPEMRFPRHVDFYWSIGGTEYTVVSHFKNNQTNDILSILSRLMQEDLQLK